MTARQLRRALERLGLSQVQLARALGVTSRTVRYWVAGHHRVPAEAVAAVTRALQQGYWPHGQ